MGVAIEHWAQVVHQVAVWTVEALLLELFDDHLPLYFERCVAEARGEHAVAFEVEECLGVVCRRHFIEVCEVVAGPCVALAAGLGELAVEVVDVGRASEHKVLEEVGHAGEGGLFVAGADVVHYVQRHHGGRRVAAVHDTQAVRQREAVCPGRAQGFSMAFIDSTRMSEMGRSLRSVCACCILSTTSMPLTTSPKTVYALSRWGVPPTSR